MWEEWHFWMWSSSPNFITTVYPGSTGAGPRQDDVTGISVFWFQPSWDLSTCGQHGVTMLHLGGDWGGAGGQCLFLQNNPKIRVRLLCTSLGFLRVYCPHHWLIELGGRPRRQTMLSTNKKWGRGLLYPGGPYRVLLGLNALFSLIFLSLEGNRNWTGKGITF